MAQTPRQQETPQRRQAKALWIKRYRASQKIGRLIKKLDAAWNDYQKLNTVQKIRRTGI